MSDNLIINTFLAGLVLIPVGILFFAMRRRPIRPIWMLLVVPLMLLPLAGLMEWWTCAIDSCYGEENHAGIVTWAAGSTVVLLAVAVVARRWLWLAWLIGLTGEVIVCSLATYFALRSHTTLNENGDPILDTAEAPWWFFYTLIESEKVPWYIPDFFGFIPQLFAVFAVFLLFVVIIAVRPDTRARIAHTCVSRQ